MQVIQFEVAAVMGLESKTPATRWCMDTAENETRTVTLTRQWARPTEPENSWTDGRGDARPVG